MQAFAAEGPDTGGTAEAENIGDRKRALALGLAAMRGGRLQEAWSIYRGVLQAHPDCAEALHYLGLAMDALGQPLPARGLLRRAVELEPDNALFHFNLALQLRASDAAEALRHAGRAAGLAPQEPDYALQYAALLSRSGRDAEALAALETALPHRPAHPRLTERLLMLAYRLDRLDLLREHIPRLAPESDWSRAGYAVPRPEAVGTEETAVADLAPHLSGAAARVFAAARDLHVIDDFLPDGEAARRHALERVFAERLYREQNFPGVQTRGQPCQAIMQRIADVLRRPIKWCSPDNGAFRVSYADSTARTDIHVDDEADAPGRLYAAVLYLNRPEQCRGGTMFWRHRATGWERRPPEGEVRAAGYAGYADFQRAELPRAHSVPFSELAARRDGWELLAEVPMRFNRLIVYRSDFYHSISSLFGSTLEDGRLVQLFLFEAMGGE